MLHYFVHFCNLLQSIFVDAYKIGLQRFDCLTLLARDFCKRLLSILALRLYYALLLKVDQNNDVIVFLHIRHIAD